MSDRRPWNVSPTGSENHPVGPAVVGLEATIRGGRPSMPTQTILVMLVSDEPDRA